VKGIAAFTGILGLELRGGKRYGFTVMVAGALCVSLLAVIVALPAPIARI